MPFGGTSPFRGDGAREPQGGTDLKWGPVSRWPPARSCRWCRLSAHGAYAVAWPIPRCS
jgi:hypothetical protein